MLKTAHRNSREQTFLACSLLFSFKDGKNVFKCLTSTEQRSHDFHCLLHRFVAAVRTNHGADRFGTVTAAVDSAERDAGAVRFGNINTIQDWGHIPEWGLAGGE